MKELKFYDQIVLYSKTERKILYEEIKKLITGYGVVCSVVYKVLEKETDRNKVAQILSQLLPNTSVKTYDIENCIDISFLNGIVYTVAFNGEIEVLSNIEYLDMCGNIWNMDLEEYKRLLVELKLFLGAK